MRFFATISGNRSNRLYRVVERASAGRAPTTASSSTLLLWMARSGGRWSDLPERLGDYRSVRRSCYRWIAMGVLDEMLETLAREADLEWLMIDSTIVCAHQHAAAIDIGGDFSTNPPWSS